MFVSWKVLFKERVLLELASGQVRLSGGDSGGCRWRPVPWSPTSFSNNEVYILHDNLLTYMEWVLTALAWYPDPCVQYYRPSLLQKSMTYPEQKRRKKQNLRDKMLNPQTVS